MELETDKQPGAKGLPWSPWWALLFVVLLYFLAPIIGGLIVTIYPAIRGWDTAAISAWLTNSTYAQFWYVLLVEAVTIGGLLLFLRNYKRRLSDIGLKRPRLKDAGLGILVYPLYFLLFAIAFVLIQAFVPGIDVNQEQQLGFDDVTGALPLILTFVSLVVLPPLVEEIMVRGLIFTSLRKKLKLWGAAFITSAVFAVAHLSGGGDAGPLYIAAVDTFILSMVLCYVRERTGSLWAGITLHALKNGVAYVSLFII